MQRKVEALNNKKLAIKDENKIPKTVFGNDEAKDEFDKTKKLEKNVDREKLVDDTDKYKYDFKRFKTIRTFTKNICEDKITIEKADEEQSYLTNEVDKFIKETRPKNVMKNKQQKFLMKNVRDFLKAK